MVMPTGEPTTESSPLASQDLTTNVLVAPDVSDGGGPVREPKQTAGDGIGEEDLVWEGRYSGCRERLFSE